MNYLGFGINEHGFYPVKEKIEDMLDAKFPENVTQLKSVLGMINYYQRHLPDLASVLEPLHSFSLPLIVAYDASPYETGAVLCPINIQTILKNP